MCGSEEALYLGVKEMIPYKNIENKIYKSKKKLNTKNAKKKKTKVKINEKLKKQF